MNEQKDSKQKSTFLFYEYTPGSLDKKTRELVLLSASALGGCRQ